MRVAGLGNVTQRNMTELYAHAPHEVLREVVDVLDEAFAPLPVISPAPVDSKVGEDGTQS